MNDTEPQRANPYLIQHSRPVEVIERPPKPLFEKDFFLCNGLLFCIGLTFLIGCLIVLFIFLEAQ